MSTLVTTNPATGERLAEYAACSDAEVDAALDRAAQVQGGWAACSSEDRAAVLRRGGGGLRAEGGELALRGTGGVGKPLGECRAEGEEWATARGH